MGLTSFQHQLTSLNATAHQHLPALVTAAVSSSQLAMTSLPSTRKLSAASSLKPSTTQASLASSSSPLYTLKVYAAKHFAQGGHGAKSIVHPSVWQYTKVSFEMCVSVMLYNISTTGCLLMVENMSLCNRKLVAVYKFMFMMVALLPKWIGCRMLRYSLCSNPMTYCKCSLLPSSGVVTKVVTKTVACGEFK